MKTEQTVRAIAEKTGGSIKDARTHLKAFNEVVEEALKNGESVELQGFVNFLSKEVPDGVARNPQTGEQVEVPAHIRCSASLAKKLRKF